MAFATSMLAGFEPGAGELKDRLDVVFFGLFGPNGPLPLHLTEYARDRDKQEKDPTFRRFADIFHHRLLLLFYRAWANAQPTVNLDRATTRRIDTYVGSFFGIGAPEFRNRDSLPDEAKLHMAGRLAMQTRSAGGLLAVLESFFDFRFKLLEFVGEWLRLSSKDWLRLGAIGSSCRLGKDAVIGRSVWNCQHKFRNICGPIGLKDFKRLLPGRSSLTRLRDTVRGYAGFGLDWDLNIVLAAAEVPRLSLGESGELGWTAWLGERNKTTDADDVIIRPNIAQLETGGPITNETHND